MAAAAAYHVEEEHLWKCPKHPSKRRRYGGICPTCLRDRLDTLCPNCCKLRPCSCVSSSSSSSSSSVSTFGVDFRRSRSVGIPFLRSNTNTMSFFRRKKKDYCDVFTGDDDDRPPESNEKIENFAKMITRSRSVSVETTSSTKGKFWLFHRFKNPKVIAQDRSPLHRG